MKYIFFFLLLLFSITSASAEQKTTSNLSRVLITCQCRYCDLEGINLNHFQPGSEDTKANPFANLGDLNASPAWLNCDFTGANLQNAILTNSLFRKTQRGYTTPLNDIIFKNASLKNSNLSNSVFYGVNFKEANVENANFLNSDISLSYFDNANLAKANLTNSNATQDAMHGWGCSFKNANLAHVNFTKANLACDFEGANLSHATFLNTTFTLTSLEDSDPTLLKTNLSHTDLRQLSLKGISNTANILNQAILCHTIMADGKENNRDC